MKIKCEYCGSLLDINECDKCYNCGKPYTNNKEYIEYLNNQNIDYSISKKEKETNKNEILNSTIGNYKDINIFKYIIIIIVILILCFITHLLFQMIN